MADFTNALGLLQIPQTQLDNPLETAQKVQTLRLGQQTAQMNAMKLQQQQQDFQDEQDIRSAAQQTGGDLDKISQVLRTRNPRAAAKYDQELAATRKAQAESDELGLKNRAATVDLLGRRASEVNGQDDWTRFINDPTFKDYTQGLNPTFNPDERDKLVNSTMSVKDQVAAHQEAVKNQLEKQKVDQAEREGTIKSDEAAQKKAEHDRQIAANIMSQVGDQASLGQGIQYLKEAGVNPNEINLYGSIYTPDIPKRAKGYLTAGQKPSTEDEKLAAYNQNAQAVKTYGPGFEGMRRRDMAEAQANKLAESTAMESIRMADQAKAREENRTAATEQKKSDAALAQKNKADQVYDEVLNGNEEVTRTIEAARQGNKTAQAALPMMLVNKLNALSGIKRVNQAEIGAIGNAGSLIDSIMGRIGQIAEGKPVPPDILRDSKALFDSLAANGESARNRAYQRIDTNYGSSYASKLPNSAPTPGYGPVEKRTLKSGETVNVRKNLSTGKYEEAK